jgi:hypothetical protein
MRRTALLGCIIWVLLAPAPVAAATELADQPTLAYSHVVAAGATTVFAAQRGNVTQIYGAAPGAAVRLLEVVAPRRSGTARTQFDASPSHLAYASLIEADSGYALSGHDIGAGPLRGPHPFRERCSNPRDGYSALAVDGDRLAWGGSCDNPRRLTVVALNKPAEQPRRFSLAGALRPSGFQCAATTHSGAGRPTRSTFRPMARSRG